MKCTKLGWMVMAVSLGACAMETGGEEALHEDSGSVSEELSRSALSPREEATVLKLIDGICADTWCGGDYNFRFDRLDCKSGCPGRPGSCKLTFRMFSHATDIATGPTYTRACKTPGFTGFDSLVETGASYQLLNWDYYEALTECIARVESNLPR